MTHYTADTLTDYLHGELDAAADAAIEQHLLACDACTATYNAEAQLGELLRGVARAEERELPAMVRAKIWDEIRQGRPSLWQRVLSWGPGAVALPAAALVALVAYLGLPVMHAGGPAVAGVSATYYLDEHRAETLQNPLADHALVVPAAFNDRSGSGAAPAIDAADAATLDGTGASN